MGSNRLSNIRPLISVGLITITLLSVAFLQMEERRLGYSLLKLTREHRKVSETKKSKEILLAKMTRPQWVEKMAYRQSTLKRAESHQIILLPETIASLDQGDLFE